MLHFIIKRITKHKDSEYKDNVWRKTAEELSYDKLQHCCEMYTCEYVLKLLMYLST